MDEALPPTLARIAQIAGVRAAILIGMHRVGWIYIPGRDHLPADHWLVGLVGMDAAMKLAITIGPGRLDIPATLVGQGRQRREAMVRMSEEGVSLTEIARRLGVNRSTVVKSRRRNRQSPPIKPLPLFSECTEESRDNPSHEVKRRGD